MHIGNIKRVYLDPFAMMGDTEPMKPKLTFLLALTFLFLFCGSVYGDDFQDAWDAEQRKDYNEAVRLYRLSAKQGNANGQYNLGVMYANGQGVLQDYKEAVRLYRLSAEQGFALGQNNLGLMYDNGQGVPQDYKEAVKWYRLSAEQGNALGQNNLGSMYAMGHGVLQHYALAHMWFNLSGSNGNKVGVESRKKIEKRMSKTQIEKAQEMARNWKPKK
jgi:uncharacterized protein